MRKMCVLCIVVYIRIIHEACLCLKNIEKKDESLSTESKKIKIKTGDTPYCGILRKN